MYFHAGESNIFTYWSKITPDSALLSFCHDQWSYQTSAERVSLWLLVSVLLSHMTARQQTKACSARWERSGFWKGSSILRWNRAKLATAEWWARNETEVSTQPSVATDICIDLPTPVESFCQGVTLIIPVEVLFAECDSQMIWQSASLDTGYWAWNRTSAQMFALATGRIQLERWRGFAGFDRRGSLSTQALVWNLCFLPPPPPKADADQKWKQIPLQRRYSTRLCNGEEQRLGEGEGAEEREMKRFLRSEK